MGNVAYARGALAYLGIPPLAVDHVASSTGSLSMSDGFAFLLGARHRFAPSWSVAFSASHYRATMKSHPEIELSTISFDYRVEGTRLQAALFFDVNKSTTVGVEAANVLTSARLRYSAGVEQNRYRAHPIRSSYPSILAFVRSSW